MITWIHTYTRHYFNLPRVVLHCADVPMNNLLHGGARAARRRETRSVGFRQLEAISDDLAKGAMGQTASSLAEGIAEQTNDYFFCAFCGALLEVASPRPATPTIVLRAHLFRLSPPSRRFGPPERSS